MPKTPTRKLKPSNETFIEAVVAGKNLTEAYLEAHPDVTRESAGQGGSRLFKSSEIQAAITERKRRAALNADISPESITGALQEIAFASLADIQLLKDGRIDWAHAKKLGLDHLIKEVKIQRYRTKDGREIVNTNFTMYSRVEALKELADHFGMRQAPRVNDADQWKIAVKMLLDDEDSGVKTVKEALEALQGVQFKGLPKMEDLDDKILSATEIS